MEFESQPSTSKGIAIFCAAFAFVKSYFAMFIATGAAAAVLALLALLGAVAAWLAYGARYCVVLDKTQGTAKKLFVVPIYRHVREFNLRQYNGVGIGIGGRQGVEMPTVAYFVQLLGTDNLHLLPATPDIDVAKTQAREIAEYLGYSLDEQPRTVAFGRRL